MTAEDQMEQEVHLIERWLQGSSEPFDDWDWNGQELTIFLHREPIEKYTRRTLAESIQGFPSN
jgi:hypothetical protein